MARACLWCAFSSWLHTRVRLPPPPDLGDLVKALLAGGADVSLRDSRGRSAAQLAHALGNREVADYLSAVERGDGSEAKTRMGRGWGRPAQRDGELRGDGQGEPWSETGERPSLEQALRAFRLGKGLPVEGPGWDKTPEERAEDAKRLAWKQFDQFRRYDGTDWADPLSVGEIKEVMVRINAASTDLALAAALFDALGARLLGTED